jgi:hypothetical protein
MLFIDRILLIAILIGCIYILSMYRRNKIESGEQQNKIKHISKHPKNQKHISRRKSDNKYKEPTEFISYSKDPCINDDDTSLSMSFVPSINSSD